MIRNRWRFSGNEWNGEKEEESEKKRRREIREKEKILVINYSSNEI